MNFFCTYESYYQNNKGVKKMFDNMTTMEILKLLAPLIVFQLGLLVYCVIDILRKGVRNLNKPLWIAILFINLIGPIAYLVLGRKRWTDD